MTIFKTAYDTTIGKSLAIEKTKNKIKETIIRNDFNTDYINLITSVNFLPVFVIGDSRYLNTDIPIFGHPMLVDNFKEKNYLSLDLRMLVNIDRETGAYLEKNKTERDLAISRFILNYIALSEGMGHLKNSLSFGGIIFSQWLSQSISKRFSLDPKDQITLSIITSIYYNSLFQDSFSLDEDSKILLAKQIVRDTNADSKYVFGILDQIEKMDDISDYCDTVKRVLENIRLKDFNVGILYTIVAMSWYGLNSKEMIAVALEHIPTWLSVCYAAVNERTFKNTTIAGVCEKYGKRGASEEFIKNYVSLISQYINTNTRTVNEALHRVTIEELENRVL